MIQIYGIQGIPLVHEGDNLGKLIFEAVKAQEIDFADNDIIVVTQKIVSKAEGQIIKLDQITPSRFAYKIAQRSTKDPRLIEIILRQSNRIIKMQKNHLITEIDHQHICANSGVDESNIEKGFVTVLPSNPDKSAARLRKHLELLSGSKLAIIIADTCGRPFRTGQINIAIGVSGIKALRDYKGNTDMFGRPLEITKIAIADELASASELVMKKRTRIPVAIIRGYQYERGGKGAKELIRTPSKDLFT